MIKLTRLDGSEMFLNPDLIEILEEIPDTHITLTNGNKYLFLEPAVVVIERIVSFKARVLRRVNSDNGKKYLQRHHSEKYRPVCKL
jgi:flagellar protein FlbD